MLVSVVTAAKRYCLYTESYLSYGGDAVVVAVVDVLVLFVIPSEDDSHGASPTTRPITRPITKSAIITVTAAIFVRRPSFILATSLCLKQKKTKVHDVEMQTFAESKRCECASSVNIVRLLSMSLR